MKDETKDAISEAVCQTRGNFPADDIILAEPEIDSGGEETRGRAGQVLGHPGDGDARHDQEAEARAQTDKQPRKRGRPRKDTYTVAGIVIEKRFYVYALCYPSGEPFYIGKGSNRRLMLHNSRARQGGTDRKSQVIREIWETGEDIVRQVLFQTDDEMDALREEARLLAMYEPGGLLTNFQPDKTKNADAVALGRLRALSPDMSRIQRNAGKSSAKRRRAAYALIEAVYAALPWLKRQSAETTDAEPAGILAAYGEVIESGWKSKTEDKSDDRRTD